MRENALPPDDLTDVALKVASEARAAGLGADVPHRDPRVDTIAMSLPSYGQFRSTLSTQEFFADLYGDVASDRIAMSWVFASVSNGSAEAAWGDFWARLSNPDWTCAAVANLINVDCD